MKELPGDLKLWFSNKYLVRTKKAATELTYTKH